MHRDVALNSSLHHENIHWEQSIQKETFSILNYYIPFFEVFSFHFQVLIASIFFSLKFIESGIFIPKMITNLDFSCDNKVNGIYAARSGQCIDWFWLCADSRPFKFDCPSGLFFNRQTKQCDYKTLIPECNDGQPVVYVFFFFKFLYWITQPFAREIKIR